VQVSGAKASVKVDSATLGRVEQALSAAGLNASRIELEGSSIKARFNTTDEQIQARDAVEKALNADPADPSHVVALNLVPRTPAWLAALHANPMYLGLDFVGGCTFCCRWTPRPRCCAAPMC